MALYKRGKTWWYEYRINGQRIRRSTGTTSRRKAEAIARHERHLLEQQQTNTRAGKSQPQQRTYADALLKWLETAPASMLSHARNTRPYLDNIELHDIPEAAHAMKADMLARGLSPLTVNRRLAVVRRILNMAWREWGWLNQQLGQRIKLLSERGTARTTHLTRAQVQQLIDAIENQTARDIIIIAAHTGMRKSEILRLRAEDWRPPYIHLPAKTKNGRPRTIPAPTHIHPHIRPPFDITDWELRKAWEHARQTINVPTLRLHDLRHTFASWLVTDPNIPITLVRDLLGHSSLAVTSKYSHLRDDGALELIENALAPTAAQSAHKNAHSKKEGEDEERS